MTQGPDMTTDREALRAAAKAATPGPWATDTTVIISKATWPLLDGPWWHDWEAKGGEPLGRFVAETRTHDAEGDANAAFIALANPQAILALLDEHDALVGALADAPILSKYHGHRGFEADRFIEDYSAWKAKVRALLSTNRQEAKGQETQP